jgi:hypothetical protein
LTEELGARTDVALLSDTDREHLAIDIRRAYVTLISEWLCYMKHLKKEYPYLFSLAARTNPFDKLASVSFTEGKNANEVQREALPFATSS